MEITISLRFVPKGPIHNIPALFQIMAWHRPRDKPLSEPMALDAPLGLIVLTALHYFSLGLGEAAIQTFALQIAVIDRVIMQV